jgi:hypothetical protein
MEAQMSWYRDIKTNANFGIFFSDAKREVMSRWTGSPATAGWWQSKKRTSTSRSLSTWHRKEYSPMRSKRRWLSVTGGDEMEPSEVLEFLDEYIGLGEFSELTEALYSGIENKKLMQAQGYDGIISSFGKDEKWEVIKEYVAFDPSQIEIIPPANRGENAVWSGKDHKRPAVSISTGNLPRRR